MAESDQLDRPDGGRLVAGAHHHGRAVGEVGQQARTCVRASARSPRGRGRRTGGPAGGPPDRASRARRGGRRRSGSPCRSGCGRHWCGAAPDTRHARARPCRTRTVAEETLTPGASTTCWEPTGWAEPMYSVTTALRIAALRASRSASPGGALFGSAVIDGRHGVHQGEVVRSGRPSRGPGRVWHSTLQSADRNRPYTPVDPGGRRQPPSPVRLPGQAEAMNIRSVMAGPRAMAASPMTRVRVPSGARDWTTAVVPGVRPLSPR